MENNLYLFETAIYNLNESREILLEKLEKHSLLKKGIRNMNEKQLDKTFMSILNKVKRKASNEDEKKKTAEIEAGYYKKDIEGKKEVLLKIIDNMHKNNPRGSAKIEQNIEQRLDAQEENNQGLKEGFESAISVAITSLVVIVINVITALTLGIIFPKMLIAAICGFLAAIILAFIPEEKLTGNRAI